MFCLFGAGVLVQYGMLVLGMHYYYYPNHYYPNLLRAIGAIYSGSTSREWDMQAPFLGYALRNAIKGRR